MYKNCNVTLKKKKLFLVVGRTASGKTTLVKKACKRLGMKMVVSYTTRPMRDDDKEFPDHRFITNEEADEILADQENIIAYTEINGNRYFTTAKMLEESDIYVIDPNGIRYMLQKYNDKYDLVIIYVSARWEVGMSRAAVRGQAEVDYNDRYEAEDEQFSAFESEMPWKYHILNLGTIEEGADKLEYIIRKERGLCEVENIHIEYINPAMLPISKNGNNESGWIGLRTAEDVDMKAGNYHLLSLGVRMTLPDGYEAHIAPRRSTFADFGILQTDSPAVIDNSHSNDVWKYAALAVRDTKIHTNDLIAQFRIMKKQPIIRFKTTKVTYGLTHSGATPFVPLIPDFPEK